MIKHDHSKTTSSIIEKYDDTKFKLQITAKELNPRDKFNTVP